MQGAANCYHSPAPRRYVEAHGSSGTRASGGRLWQYPSIYEPCSISDSRSPEPRGANRKGAKEVNQHRSTWSIQVGSVASIAIRIHVTFLLLFAYFVYLSPADARLNEALFITAVFGCVLAHELGHALVARYFGIHTNDITLYPFGGIASITSQPAPKAELAIALAGPLVNVLVALLLLPSLDFSHLAAVSQAPPEEALLSFQEKIFIANVSIGLFNLLPALPMDGGRVLRALLALCNSKNATFIAARVSKVLCVLMALGAVLIGQPILLLISFIIFIGAVQEHVRAESRSLAEAFLVEDVMVAKEKLETLPHGTTISKALRASFNSLQPLFLVTVGDEPQGVVFREEILEHAATTPDDYISAIVFRDLPAIDARAPLSQALALLEEEQSHVALVTRDGVFAGIASYDRVADFLLMKGVRNHFPPEEETEWPTPP